MPATLAGALAFRRISPEMARVNWTNLIVFFFSKKRRAPASAGRAGTVLRAHMNFGWFRSRWVGPRDGSGDTFGRYSSQLRAKPIESCIKSAQLSIESCAKSAQLSQLRTASNRHSSARQGGQPAFAVHTFMRAGSGACVEYRGASLIRNTSLLRPYSRTIIPGVLWCWFRRYRWQCTHSCGLVA